MRTKLIFIIFLCFFSLTALDAATYAFINISGRNEKSVLREKQTVISALKVIPGAKLIYSHKEKKGWVFKKIVLTLILSGKANTLNKILGKFPYPCDNIKEVVMEIKYTSKNKETGDYASSILFKKFSNIKKCTDFLKSKGSVYYWKYLNRRSAKEFNKHLDANGKVNLKSTIELHFYTFQPSSKNHIFSISSVD
ncbi:hypothetical protein ACFL35_05575 [Candidatus Riflebacteria bacterium]